MFNISVNTLTLSPPGQFLAKYKFCFCFLFFRKFIATLVFMRERFFWRPFFFREQFKLFFHKNMKKLKNQARNEIFRQIPLTLTLMLDVK